MSTKSNSRQSSKVLPRFDAESLAASAANTWLARLQTAIAGQADKIPPGWFCATDFRNAKMTRRTFENRIRDGVKLGILKRQKFKVVLNGKFRRVFYYKEV